MSYIQCKLVCRNVESIVWIPKKFAIKGDILKLRKDDIWEDGWLVKNVYSEADLSEIPDSPRWIRRHKDITGDSFKKGP